MPSKNYRQNLTKHFFIVLAKVNPLNAIALNFKFSSISCKINMLMANVTQGFFQGSSVISSIYVISICLYTVSIAHNNYDCVN